MSLQWTYCIKGQKKIIEAPQLKNLIMWALFTPEFSCFFFFLKHGILQAKPQLHRSGLQDPIGPHNRSQSQQRSSSTMVANGVLAVVRHVSHGVEVSLCEFWEVTRPVGDWVSQELSLMDLRITAATGVGGASEFDFRRSSVQW